MENGHETLGRKMTKVQEEIAAYREYAQGVIINMQTYLEHEDVLEELIKMPNYYSSSVPWGGSFISVYFQLNHHSEMVPILKFLGQKGYKQQTKPYNTSSERIWNCGMFELRAIFTGERCKFVQVGENTHTIPIMEIKCDD